MEFSISEQGKIIEDQLLRFIKNKIIPNEQQVIRESA